MGRSENSMEHGSMSMTRIEIEDDTRQAPPAPPRTASSRLSANDLLQKILTKLTKIFETEKKIAAMLNKM